MVEAAGLYGSFLLAAERLTAHWNLGFLPGWHQAPAIAANDWLNQQREAGLRGGIAL